MSKIKCCYFILPALSLLFLAACSASLSIRQQKDITTTLDNSHKLTGRYRNLPIDSNRYYRSIVYQMFGDTASYEEELIVELTVIDNYRIELSYYHSDSIINSKILRGKYEKGYFMEKLDVDTSFPIGPLLWVLSYNQRCIGLSNQDNLVLINSGWSAMGMMVFFPVFADGEDEYQNEYLRIKK